MKVKIKLNANKIYKLGNFGKIETDIMEQLYQHTDITKKKENVAETVENLLYKGLPVRNIYIDMLTIEAVLEIDLDE